MHKQYTELDIGKIVVRKRSRQDDGDLSDLVSSIQKLGLLHPIIVDANNVLLAGGRRLAGCRQAGLTTIPAFRLDVAANPMLALDVQADENLCRKPLSPEELDSHIRMKKSAMGVKPTGGATGFLAGLKRLMGRR